MLSLALLCISYSISALLLALFLSPPLTVSRAAFSENALESRHSFTLLSTSFSQRSLLRYFLFALPVLFAETNIARSSIHFIMLRENSLLVLDKPLQLINRARVKEMVRERKRTTRAFFATMKTFY